MDSKILFSTYVYPAWHTVPERCALYGPSWTEWELFNTRSVFFPDQKLTPRPLWGFYDDTEEKDVLRQVDTALEHGIDIFIYLYYWSPSGVDLEPALETFIRVSETSPMHFALIWSPHRPRFEVIRPLEKKFDYELNREIDMDEQAFKDFIVYTCEKFFSRQNYLLIDNRPVLYLYKYFEFVRKLGDQKFSKWVRFAHEYLKSKGFDGLYLVASSEKDPETFSDTRGLGFSATTSYVLLPDFHTGPPIQDYAAQLSKKQIQKVAYQEMAQLPYIPSVPVGFDASSRGEAGKKPPIRLGTEDVYPWFPIVKNRSLEAFSECLENACDFVLRRGGNNSIVNIASWNEWTQQHYLEPDIEGGYEYLQTVKRLKEKKK